MSRSLKSMTVIFLCLAAIGSALAAAHAQETGSIAYGVLKSNCVKSCAEAEDAMAFCNQYCDCTVSELKSKGDASAVRAVLASEAALTEVALMCAGRTTMDRILTDCAEDCGAEPECRKSCSCLSDKLKAFGTETEFGDLITRAGQDDPKALAQMEALKNACPRS